MNGLKTFFAQLGARRLMLMGGVALMLMVALAAVAFRGTPSDMGFLYTDLDPAAAQAIIEKLKAQKIPFQLSADGTSVMAPQAKLAELRMGMAADQISGKIGYDVLDAEEPFGVSSSRARMNETRAIEGELTKSIETLDAVIRARIQLVMPERAMFAAESRKATASVTVKTKGRLNAGAIQAIRYLVASAVPELSPEAVSIVDQSGVLLARAGEAGEASASQADEREQAIEQRLRAEIESMIEPIVGVGKVRAEVAVQISRDQTREEARVFDPDKQVIAHQTTVTGSDQNNEIGAGAPGTSVAAQLPENQGQPPGVGGDTRKSARNDNSEDTTYDNSQTHSVTVKGAGKTTRLTVAVMVDGGTKPIAPAQIQRLTRLVENAVGFDSGRGDSVIVENMTFAAADALAGSEAGFFSEVTMDQVLGVVKLLVIAVVGLVALRMLRPKATAADAATTIDGGKLIAQGDAPTPAAGPQGLLADQSASDTGLLDQEIALAQVDGRIKLSALRRIGDAISSSPVESASVIRQWMNA